MRLLFLLASMIILSSCSLAPAYHTPTLNIGEHYKESPPLPAKKAIAIKIPHVPWWEIFNDPELNALEQHIACVNQNWKAAFARYQAALAIVQINRSAFFPTIRGIANASRQQTSGNIANKDSVPLFSDMNIGATLSYEMDVFGRVRNAVAASEYNAKASAADLASLDLSIHAQLAEDYLALRSADATQKILDKIVVAYRKALYLTQKRHEGGAVAEVDVDQAQAQLEDAKTLAAEEHVVRAQLEHAIATLMGLAPANFTLPFAPLTQKKINIAAQLPSSLLKRRPDIIAAEQRVKAANAEIGVARAAFFPDFNLVAQGGFESAVFAKLFSMPSLMWSLGSSPSLTFIDPTAVVTLFDGGALSGRLKLAKANYYETVANYRQTVLNALREVEDYYVAQHRLEQALRTETLAEKAADRALAQAGHRYKGGIVTYLNVVVSEDIALQTKLSVVNILLRRQVATVQLIKALGGSMTTA